MTDRNIKNLENLSRMLGLDDNDLLEYLNWCLLEHLINELVQIVNLKELRVKSDALSHFRKLVEDRTKTKWDIDNTKILYEKALQLSEKHYRQKITYEEILRLLINTRLECVKCGKKPPDVILHIDHIFPASKGGLSKYENLRFLCSECNLKKSDKIERSNLWLKLESLQPS